MPRRHGCRPERGHPAVRQHRTVWPSTRIAPPTCGRTSTRPTAGCTSWRNRVTTALGIRPSRRPVRRGPVDRTTDQQQALDRVTIQIARGGATTRTMAPEASIALHSLPIPARSASGPATTPITRPAIGPGPGDSCDSAGEGVTSAGSMVGSAPAGRVRPRRSRTGPGRRLRGSRACDSVLGAQVEDEAHGGASGSAMARAKVALLTT
jgi:hypothetical protein